MTKSTSTSVYIYSTIANDVIYAIYDKEIARKDIDVIKTQIFIKGGTGVMQSKDGSLWTPRGVATKITEEQFDLLKDDYHFKEHMRLGYITVAKREESVEKMYKTMTPLDNSAQITPDWYVKNANKVAANPMEGTRLIQ